jgi:hypothetical protein
MDLALVVVMLPALEQLVLDAIARLEARLFARWATGTPLARLA